MIDDALSGYQKDYTRDQSVVAKDVPGWVAHQQVWDFTYPSEQGNQAAAPAASDSKPDTKDQVEDAVTKGFKSLKKLF